jgi:hypothetical protein
VPPMMEPSEFAVHASEDMLPGTIPRSCMPVAAVHRNAWP